MSGATETVAAGLGAIGGIGGIGAAIKWWFEQRRIQREEQAAQRREEREAAERLGRALTESAAAQNRMADAYEELERRLEGVERLLGLTNGGSR